MPASLVVVLAAGLGWYGYTVATGLRRNIAKARSTELPYVVAPWSAWSMTMQLFSSVWTPLVKLLPARLWESWLDVTTADWSNKSGFAPFARIGDTFLVVTPFDIVLNTASAEAIRQFSFRREQFPKNVASYDILRLFGDNVVTTEGATWRLHRKITSASFNERNAAMVFSEAVSQSGSLLRVWQSRGGHTIDTLEGDTMKLALHIICYVGFGMTLSWPGEDGFSGGKRWEKYGTLTPRDGFSMSFVDAVARTLEKLIMILLLPSWLLRTVPLKKFRETSEAYDNYNKYMASILADKREAELAGEHTEGMDLIGQLVRTNLGPSDASSPSSTTPTTTTTTTKETPRPLAKESSSRPLTDLEILGNVFIMMVAGHETSAGALHFTLIELASHPAAQRMLQRDVDAIVGRDTDPATWAYETHCQPLLESMVGAAMYETLRVMPPVVGIPKIVSHGREQGFTLDGKTHVLPPAIDIDLIVSAVHRNPRYYPTPKPSDSNDGDGDDKYDKDGKANDLADWIPERWFRKSLDRSPAGQEPMEDSPDTSAAMFRPERGAYIPFSEGPRACLGRRVAVVEIVASLAVIFQHYSLELAVDDWATDDEVDEMSRDERRRLYAKAQDRCEKTLANAGTIVTLRLKDGGKVPVRLVKRGEEKFVSWMD